MKLVSWNVNGLRACVNKGFLGFFKEADADIFCIQETKMQEEQVEFVVDGYHRFFNSADKKGYSGTAVYTRQKPMNASYGIGIDKHDHEGRVITLEYDGFFLVNVYTPNSQRELLRLSYRMDWEDDFRAYLLELNRKKPVILCGDLNCAHEEIDIFHAKTNRKNAGFTDDERAKMTALLESGFTDSFRFLYPDTKHAYTWWSYMGNSREKNVGWRIDYFVVSDSLRDNITAAEIFPQVYGSDHCPVGLTVKL